MKMTLGEVMRLDTSGVQGKIAPLLGYRVLGPGEYLNGRWASGTVYSYWDANGVWWRWSATDEIISHDGFTEWRLDWDTAMKIREWAQGLPNKKVFDWVIAVDLCVAARTGERFELADAMVNGEPIDYCRAALLVER